MSSDLRTSPFPPGYRELRLRCVQSALTGDPILVVYHGGSQPGCQREIGPVAWVGPGALRAWCMATGYIKTYRLTRISLVVENESHPHYQEPST